MLERVLPVCETMRSPQPPWLVGGLLPEELFLQYTESSLEWCLLPPVSLLPYLLEVSWLSSRLWETYGQW